ncbi:MAG: STAS domain-containing protein, partial [Solirubrobacteraceae bacterium]
MAFDPTGFSISISDRDGCAVVVIRGELDLATAPELEGALTERLDAGEDVVVDLRELAFLDSTGLR